MTTLVPPQCWSCKHRFPSVPEWNCAAFPEGIPQEVLDWRVDHRQPLPGDGGIQFEQNPDMGEPMWELLRVSSNAS